MELIYNFLIVGLVLWSFFCKKIKKEQAKKIYMITTVLALTLLSAFRYQLDRSDFQNNLIQMKQAYALSFQDVIKKEEIPIWIIRWVLSKISTNPQIFFIATSMAIVLSYARIISKYSDDFYLSIVMFYSIGGYFSSMNITCQYVAISICLLSIPYIIDRKAVHFGICMVIAVLIHSSAIAFIPMYFLYLLYINKKNVIWYILCSLTFFTSIGGIINLLQTRFHLYEEFSDGFYGTNTANVVNIAVPALVLILYIWCLSSKSLELQEIVSITDKIDNLFFHMAIWNFMCNLYAITNMMIVARIGHYFNACVIYLPMLLAKKRTSNSKMIHHFLYILCIVYIFFMNYMNKLQPNPYRLFWNV